MSESRWGGRSPADLVPENAPFDEEQRAWLNGFLAGLLGLAQEEADGASRVGPASLSGGSSPPDSDPPPAWRNAALSLEQRLQASEGAAIEERLCSALPQLDCGQCGSSCEEYARALASGAERDVTRCGPGGREVLKHLERLLAESARFDRAYALGGVARRSAARAPEPEPPPVSLISPRSRLAPPRREPRQAHRLEVKSQRKLTLADAGSEIREIVLGLGEPTLEYRAGDCLAVFPHNDPDLVRALLRAVGARGQEVVTTAHGATEVWRCLLEDLDITHVREETLRLFADGAARQVELGELCEPRSDSLSDSLPSGFDLLDLLSMFPGQRPSLEHIVRTLGALEPRLYAVASSPTHHPGELHLAVRVVRAERGGRERKGVASHFLTEGVFRGDEVFARVQPADGFVLAAERTSPLILLGSGTGVARFRALLQALEARGRRGNTWLILASCFEGDEALYQAEIEAWSRSGVLEHLDVLKLSQRGRRAGPEEVFRKRARRLVSWLDRGAFVYVCGEGKGFSALLSDTLIDVLGRQGKMSRAEAADLLHLMRREGRYVEEVY